MLGPRRCSVGGIKFDYSRCREDPEKDCNGEMERRKKGRRDQRSVARREEEDEETREGGRSLVEDRVQRKKKRKKKKKKKKNRQTEPEERQDEEEPPDEDEDEEEDGGPTGAAYQGEVTSEKGADFNSRWASLPKLCPRWVTPPSPFPKLCCLLVRWVISTPPSSTQNLVC